MKSIIAMLAFALSLQAYAAPKDEVKVDAPQTTVKSEVQQNSHADDLVNIRIEPLWLVLGDLAMDFQFRIGNHFSVGPTLAYMPEGRGIHSAGHIMDRTFYDEKTERVKYGLRAAYYFSGVNQRSAFISLFANHADNTVTSESDSFLTEDSGTTTGEFSEDTAGITAGYQWQWSLVKFNVGAGLVAYNTPEQIELKNSDGSSHVKLDLDHQEIGLALDLGVGLTF